MRGETISGRYRLVEQLGAGAMSEVWRAEDEELERTVAVKLLRPDADRARFDREARAVAALSHPNINQLYDYGEVEGRPYMVLEYLSGGSLHERLRRGKPLEDAETKRVATDMAAGLAHAHAQGLVHRDLKPANVLFDAEGRAKLADFGIARLGGAGTLTEAGTVLGTAAFISPEQASGQPATPASDVYSFGVILFRLLTGRLPFESDDALALATLHATQPPPAASEIRPDVPGDLEALAAACLAKRPGDRPPDGDALLRALTSAAPVAALIAAAAPADTAATQVLPGVPPPRPPRRRVPALAAAAALLVLGAAGAAVAFLSTRSGSSPEPASPPLSLPSVTARATEPTFTPPATTEETTTEETTTRARTTQPITTAPTTTQTLPTAPTGTTTAATTATTTQAAPGG